MRLSRSGLASATDDEKVAFGHARLSREEQMAFTRHRAREKYSHSTLDPVRVKTDGTTTAGSKDQDPHEERLRARVKQNTAYEKYKASLHEFFDGGKPLPDSLRAMLATRPGADAHLGVSDEERAEAEAAAAEANKEGAKKSKKKKSAPVQKERGEETRRARRLAPTGGEDYKGLIGAIRRATSPREVEGAIDALKTAGYALPPNDGELLSKALGHKDEAVICEALRGLLDIAAAGLITSPRLLRTRIENVALLASSSECRELCGELKSKLS